MILPPFRYLRPADRDDAIRLLRDIPGATVLAGGQTLVNALKLDLISPTAVIDVHRLAELRGVQRTDDGVRIGAATTYAEIAADAVVRAVVPSVSDMAAGLVDRQVRNRGTIGGNCALNDPTNNFPPLLAALGATFEVFTAAGEAVMTADEFFRGTLLTAVSGGGLLSAVRIPALPATSTVVHRHMQLAKDSWALARTVVRLDLRDGMVVDSRVYLGAVPDAPLRLSGVESAVAGRTADSSLIDRALTAFDAEPFDAVTDTHGSGTYRRAMARVQLRRALQDAMAQDSTGRNHA